MTHTRWLLTLTTFSLATRVFLVLVCGRPLHAFLLVHFVLEAIVDDECGFVDVEVGSCRCFWGTSSIVVGLSSHCVLHQYLLVGLICHQIDMLMGQSIHIGEGVLAHISLLRGGVLSGLCLHAAG